MPPLRASFRFLNITNLEAVRQGAKPELVRHRCRWRSRRWFVFPPGTADLVQHATATTHLCWTVWPLLLGWAGRRRRPHRRRCPPPPPAPQQEVGPYAFQAVRVKRNVQFVRGGAAVRWNEYRYFRPLPELSNGSLSDPITTLNVPLVGESCWAAAAAGLRAGLLWPGLAACAAWRLGRPGGRAGAALCSRTAPPHHGCGLLASPPPRLPARPQALWK